MSAICDLCKGTTVEFPSMRELIEHRNKVHVGGVPKVVKKEEEEELFEEEKPQKEVVIAPIELRYKFDGSCPHCGRFVDTIEVAIQAGWIAAIAYCPLCHKQLKTQKVLPIDGQGYPTGEKKK